MFLQDSSRIPSFKSSKLVDSRLANHLALRQALAGAQVRWLSLLLLLSATAVQSMAQTSSTVLGLVRDPSGAVVQGAKITLRNDATSQYRTVATGEDGAYRLAALQPGHYSLEFSKSGFRTELQSGITLDVAQEVTINVVLQVAGAEERVFAVAGRVSPVNSTGSSLGGLVDEVQTRDLPLNGRNYVDMALLQPGVSQNKNVLGMAGLSGTVFSTNGAPILSNSFLLDGASTVNQSGWMNSTMAGTTLGVDGIAEFKVVTGTFSAEYGMTMGSQIVIVSRSGANQFHGDVFDYLRNNALDARNYFDGPTLPPLRRNNFGGALGGPIRKDRSFFFGVYEGLRLTLGYSGIDTVPPAACHGPAGGVLWNGLGTEPAGALGLCPMLGPNPSGPGTNAVTISSITAPLLALYPNPTNAAASNNFVLPTSNKNNVDYGQARFDEQFTSADTFFARYTVDQSNLDNAFTSSTLGGGSGSGGVAYPQFRGKSSSFDQFVTLSESHVFSSSLLNAARVSFSRTNFGPENNTTVVPGVSFVGSNLPLGTLSVTPFSQNGGGDLSGPPSVQHRQNIYAFGDDLYWERKKHGMKFGVLSNLYNQAITAPLFTLGFVTYGSLTNFLKAIPDSYTASTPGSDCNRFFVYRTNGFYAQDDWRWRPRLTLNLGLRYEFATTPGERNGKGYAIRNHGMDATPTHGPVMQDKSYSNFSPRLGFAWNPRGDGNTAVHGGIGMYYDLGAYGGALTWNAIATPPLSSTSSADNTTAQAVVAFPLVFIPAQIGASIGGPDYNVNQPHLLEYNLALERQLPWAIALSVAYAGSRGAHLWQEREGNPAIPAYVAEPGVRYWANTASICANAVPSCRANPHFTSNVQDSTDAFSRYNGLQVNVQKRLGEKLHFQGAYTWSHMLDPTQGQLLAGDCAQGTGMDHPMDVWANARTDYGPSCFDLRHNLHFDLIYRLPAPGRGNALARILLDGWWTGNIVALQTGYPFSVAISSNRSNSQAGGDRANVGRATVAPGQTAPDGSVNTTSETFVPFDSGKVITGKPNQWFNPLMFSMTPEAPCPNDPSLYPSEFCGTLGDASKGLLRGPGLATWDFSLVKDTRTPFLGQAGKLQFRAEFFNLLNRANFGMPDGTAFSGALTDMGSYSEAPLPTAGLISTTSTPSRQIQLALKIIF